MRKKGSLRRLVVDETTTYLWSVRHRHGDGRPCEEVVGLHRDGTCTRIVFREGPGRPVEGGYQPGHCVIDEHGNHLNLNEPGSVRALVDEAARRGLLPCARDLDGWELLRAIGAGRPRQPSGRQSQRPVRPRSRAAAAVPAVEVRSTERPSTQAWAPASRNSANSSEATPPSGPTTSTISPSAGSSAVASGSLP